MPSKTTNQFQLMAQVEQSVMDWFVICAALLAIKMLFSILAVTYNRIKLNIGSNPEDKAKLEMKYPEVNAAVTRCNRIVANDMENIVPFYFLGLFFCSVIGPEIDSFYAKSLFTVFVACRYITTLCHYYAIQPFRTISWMVAYGVNALLLYHIIENISPLVTRYL